MGFVVVDRREFGDQVRGGREDRALDVKVFEVHEKRVVQGRLRQEIGREGGDPAISVQVFEGSDSRPVELPVICIMDRKVRCMARRAAGITESWFETAGNPLIVLKGIGLLETEGIIPVWIFGAHEESSRSELRRGVYYSEGMDLEPTK